MSTPSPHRPAFRTLPFWLAFLYLVGLGVFACSGAPRAYRVRSTEPPRVLVIPDYLEDDVPICVRVTAAMLFLDPYEQRGTICLETVGHLRSRAVGLRETN